jgi:uncharacterized protein YybS (DUF2232 family)
MADAPQPFPLQISDYKISAIRIVETAFFASTASLIWLISTYLSLNFILKIFFPIPAALVYLRWGKAAAIRTTTVSFLLLVVLQGVFQSILFVIPYGILGIIVGFFWRQKANWLISILVGSLFTTFGRFFQIWLASILVGEDLWLYITMEMTEMLHWIFDLFGLLIQPSLFIVQAFALLMMLISNIIYLFAVNLTASLLLHRFQNYSTEG